MGTIYVDERNIWQRVQSKPDFVFSVKLMLTKVVRSVPAHLLYFGGIQVLLCASRKQRFAKPVQS
jgi:hypothetical protein